MEKPEYLIGQRVLLGNFEIGTVARLHHNEDPSKFLRVERFGGAGSVLVPYSYVKPLPNGQL